MRETLERLGDIVDRHAGRLASSGQQGGTLSRIGLYADPRPAGPVGGLYPPTMALILSGAKQITIGRNVLRYDPASYFIATVALPATGCQELTRPGETYRAVSLLLDLDVVASLPIAGDAGPDTCRTAFAVNLVTPDLLEAMLRLLRLLDAPEDAAALAPLAEREILYRLLRGPQGGMLRQMANGESRHARIRRAIGLIRDGFDRPIRAERLADAAGMSLASLHRHFRAATAMSPLQYQKALRLHEARRLLMTGRECAAAAYAVGYESPSQFSRDFTRLFGASPSRTAAGLSAVTAETPARAAKRAAGAG